MSGVDRQLEPPIQMASLQGRLDSIHERSNLTGLQMLHWVGQTLRGETPLFNTVLVYSIAGAVKPESFQLAFQALLDHSDALRAVIQDRDGIPWRTIRPPFPYTLEYLDFSAHPQPEEAFEAWLRKRCVVPLRIDEYLFDSALARLAADRYAWYLNQHHIIADASSFFLTFRRLAELYERAVQGEPLIISDVPAYEAYAAYERAYRLSSQYAKVQNYWKSKFAEGAEPVAFLDQTPRKKTLRVHRRSYDLGADRSSRLRDLAKRREIFTVSDDMSLSNVFATVFSAYLHLLTGSRRVRFVTPVHNRLTQTLRDTIGLVMEMCPLQVDVSEGETFLTLISKVKREARTAMTNSQCASWVAVQHAGADVMFNMHHVPDLDLAGAPVHAERVHPGYGTETLALHVNDLTSSGRFVVHFDFNCDVFSPDGQQEITHSFVTLIDALLDDPGQRVDAVGHRRAFGACATSVSTEPFGPPSSAANVEAEALAHVSTGGPRDPLESQLMHIWERVLEVHPISARDNFFDVGGTSWLAVRLVAEIETAVGISIPVTSLLQSPTIEAMANTLRTRVPATPWSPLVPVKPTGTRRPLFCVHAAGGHVLYYRDLANHLDREQPILAFQAVGLEEGQAPHTRIEDMAACYISAMREAQPTGPYLLAGYSMGGMVAFEMARQLQALGQDVALLAIIDVPAQSPHFKYLRTAISALSAVCRVDAQRQLRWFLWLRHYAFRLRYLSRLSLHGRYAYALCKLSDALSRTVPEAIKRAWHSSSAVLHQPALKQYAFSSSSRIKRIHAINEEAYEAYVPQAYSGDITLIRSSEGYTGDPDKDYSPDPYLGWARVVLGRIEVHEVPGDHDAIIREPNVGILARALSDCLARVTTQQDSRVGKATKNGCNGCADERSRFTVLGYRQADSSVSEPAQ